MINFLVYEIFIVSLCVFVLHKAPASLYLCGCVLCPSLFWPATLVFLHPALLPPHQSCPFPVSPQPISPFTYFFEPKFLHPICNLINNYLIISIWSSVGVFN